MVLLVNSDCPGFDIAINSVGAVSSTVEIPPQLGIVETPNV